MADAASGVGPKKLSTKDILAAARAQAKGAGGDAPAPTAESAPAAPSAVTPAPAAVAASPAATPAAPKAPAKVGSTSDILAAARAQAAAKKAAEGGAAPAAVSPAPAAKAPAAGGEGKPKSTAEILAAARAKAGKPAEPAGATAAVVSTESAAKSVAVKANGESAAAAANLSVEQLVAGLRPAPVSAPVEKKVEAVVPVMPTKPVPAKKAAAKEERRSFLKTFFGSAFAIGWIFCSAVGAVWGLATARFMLPNVLTEPPRKFKIGPASDYDLGTVATKWVASYGVWIVHTEQYQGRNLIYALASVCTHLGCTPSWLDGEQKFKCPCHGSGFYMSGINFEGPAPRPLERVGIRIAEDGMLEVDKSVKFQEEMGQWADPTSYIEIG